MKYLFFLMIFISNIAYSKDLKSKFYDKNYKSQIEMSNTYCFYDNSDTSSFIVIGYKNTTIYFDNQTSFNSFKTELNLKRDFYFITKNSKVRVNYFTNKIVLENRIDNIIIDFSIKDFNLFYDWLNGIKID